MASKSHNLELPYLCYFEKASKIIYHSTTRRMLSTIILLTSSIRRKLIRIIVFLFVECNFQLKAIFFQKKSKTRGKGFMIN